MSTGAFLASILKPNSLFERIVKTGCGGIGHNSVHDLAIFHWKIPPECQLEIEASRDTGLIEHWPVQIQCELEGEHIQCCAMPPPDCARYVLCRLREAGIASGRTFANLQVFRATLFYRQYVCLHLAYLVVELQIEAFGQKILHHHVQFFNGGGPLGFGIDFVPLAVNPVGSSHNLVKPNLVCDRKIISQRIIRSHITPPPRQRTKPARITQI